MRQSETERETWMDTVTLDSVNLRDITHSITFGPKERNHIFIERGEDSEKSGGPSAAEEH